MPIRSSSTNDRPRRPSRSDDVDSPELRARVRRAPCSRPSRCASRRRRIVVQELLEVARRLERVPALQGALREVQQHHGVLAERVRLEECRASHLELPLVEEARPPPGTAAGHLRRRVVGPLRKGDARREGRRRERGRGGARGREGGSSWCVSAGCSQVGTAPREARTRRTPRPPQSERVVAHDTPPVAFGGVLGAGWCVTGGGAAAAGG